MCHPPTVRLPACPRQDNLLWERLTAREHLYFFGRLKNLKGRELAEAVEAALQSVNLYNGGVGDKQVRVVACVCAARLRWSWLAAWRGNLTGMLSHLQVLAPFLVFDGPVPSPLPPPPGAGTNLQWRHEATAVGGHLLHRRPAGGWWGAGSGRRLYSQTRHTGWLPERLCPPAF